jgi:hypothetical protein
MLDLGARRGWVVSGRFTPGKDPVHIVQEAGWVPGLVWTCVKNLAPTGIQSLDCPARSQSLYQLSYPVHINKSKASQIWAVKFPYFLEISEVAFLIWSGLQTRWGHYILVAYCFRGNICVTLFLDVFVGSWTFCPLIQIFSVHLEFYIKYQQVMWNIQIRTRSGGSFLNILVICRYSSLFYVVWQLLALMVFLSYILHVFRP